MSYKLKFLPSALKERRSLDAVVQTQFKKKLLQILLQPHVKAQMLRGFKRTYKVKLRASGYRLVYEACDDQLYVLVIAVGKRDKGWAYTKAQVRKTVH